jgi:hypothetical protein
VKKEQLEKRRAFNEALCARVRLIAAERNLPDAEIKWIGRLRHHDMMRFVSQHIVSVDWLLCGCLKGRLRMARGLLGMAQPILMARGRGVSVPRSRCFNRERENKLRSNGRAGPRARQRGLEELTINYVGMAANMTNPVVRARRG